VTNMAAWLAGTICVQAGILLLLSSLRPDPAYGVYGTLFFAGLFNILGTLCGLIGYAIAGAMLPSRAGAWRSFAAGAAWVVTIMGSVYVSVDLPGSWQPPTWLVLSLIIGATSYSIANRRGKVAALES
jgi:hypothetical protein